MDMRLILTSFVFATLFFAGCSDDDDNTTAGGTSGGGAAVSFPLEGVLSVGGGHVCLAESNGGVRCWGSGADGRLGTNNTTDRNGPMIVWSAEDGDVVSTTGIAVDGVGLLGRGAGATPSYGATDDVLTPIAAEIVAAGGAHNCAVGFDGGVRCWGNNLAGQVGRVRSWAGDGMTVGATVRSATYPVAALVSAPGAVSAASSDTLTPIIADNYFYGISGLSAGDSHTCAIYDTVDAMGVVACWGNSASGQVGEGIVLDSNRDAANANTSASADSPQIVTGVFGVTGRLEDIVQVAAGEGHTCALSEGAEVYCWGLGVSGQLGIGSAIQAGRAASLGNNLSSDEPFQVLNTSGDSGNLGMVAQVVSGGNHSCALSTGGSVYCWGFAQNGQLGVGTTINTANPATVTTPGNSSSDQPLQVLNASGDSGFLSGIAQLAAGTNHTCALSNSRRVYCWGFNNTGQLGVGTTIRSALADDTAANQSSDVPLAVVDVSGDDGQGMNGTLSNVISIAAGGNQTCALQSTGRIVCWGANSSGSLGLGGSANIGGFANTTASSDAPVTVRAGASSRELYTYEF